MQKSLSKQETIRWIRIDLGNRMWKIIIND